MYLWVQNESLVDSKWVGNVFLSNLQPCGVMGAFRPFTLRLNIERYDFNYAMFLVKSLFLSIVSFCSVSPLGPFYLYRTPLNMSCRVVSRLQNWSMTGNSGRSLFLHQF